jgi:hypothetical protein
MKLRVYFAQCVALFYFLLHWFATFFWFYVTLPVMQFAMSLTLLEAAFLYWVTWCISLMFFANTKHALQLHFRFHHCHHNYHHHGDHHCYHYYRRERPCKRPERSGTIQGLRDLRFSHHNTLFFTQSLVLLWYSCKLSLMIFTNRVNIALSMRLQLTQTRHVYFSFATLLQPPSLSFLLPPLSTTLSFQSCPLNLSLTWIYGWVV